MQCGVVLPQYDFSVPGEWPLRWTSVAEHARLAEAAGFDSVWLSDHLFLDLERYGGPSGRVPAYEPLTTLAAVARTVSRVRLGTLVLCEALRPASVTAKALATLDVISDGRVDVGIGAGWYEAEYREIGMELPPPGARLARLREAIHVLRGLLPGGPFSFDGDAHAAHDAHNQPAARQRPRPPIVVGGKGDRLLRLVAELADGWNTCWVWTPDAYRERAAVLDRACEAVGRDPVDVRRSLGLYALCGEDGADLERRFERVRAAMPGAVGHQTLDEWRVGRLVGTVEEIRAQVEEWADLGVDEIIVSPGAVPFQVVSPDDVELLGAALTRGSDRVERAVP